MNPRASNEFKTAFANCLELFQVAGGETAAMIKSLQDSRFEHTVTPTPDNVSSAAATSSVHAGIRANGSPGRGSGSTVRWNFKNRKPYRRGEVARDPCATLLHELAHSRDIDQGRLDLRRYKRTGIKTAEVRACTEENRYRRAAGLPQRQSYGRRPLPPEAKS